MGPPEPEAKLTSPVIDSGHGRETSNCLSTHPATASGDINEQNHGKTSTRSSSSSSSPSSSSSSGDWFGLDVNETSKSTSGDTGLPRHDKDARESSSRSYDSKIPVSAMPLHEQHSNHTDKLSSNNGLETQSPATQVMERPPDTSLSPSYRIPPSVFATNKSNNTMEWSVASNESLFSIHMGNMSFTRDLSLSFADKPSELGLPGDSPYSGPLIDFSNNVAPSSQPAVTEIGRKNANGDEHSVEMETPKAAAEAKTPVKEEKENDRSKGKSSLSKELLHCASTPRRSDASGASTKSFAFPILTGESWQKPSQKQPPKAAQTQSETPKEGDQQQKAERLSQPDSPKPEAENAPKGTQNATWGKWFSCFPCCSS